MSVLGLHLVKVLVQEQCESIWTLFASIRVDLISSTEIDLRVDVLDPRLEHVNLDLIRLAEMVLVEFDLVLLSLRMRGLV